MFIVVLQACKINKKRTYSLLTEKKSQLEIAFILDNRDTTNKYRHILDAFDSFLQS